MTLNQLQTYIVGVLQGYFPNKAVLDKLSESTDGTLLFNGQPISGEAIVTDAELQQAIVDTLEELGITDEDIEASVSTIAALQTAIVKGANKITITKPLTVTKDVTLKGEEPITIVAPGITDVFTVTSGTLTFGENINVESDISMLWAKDGGNIVIDGANLVNTSEECLGAADAGSTITMKSGIMQSNGSVMTAMNAGARFIVEGGLIETTGGTEEKPYCAVFAQSDAIVEVTGGEIKAAVGNGLIATTKGTVKVSGGNIRKIRAHKADTALVEISGGTITGELTTADDAKITITGGVFDTDPSAYVADDYTVLSDDGVWTVVANVQ